MTDRKLFEMNDHGDTWTEPELPWFVGWHERNEIKPGHMTPVELDEMGCTVCERCGKRHVGGTDAHDTAVPGDRR